MKIGNITLKLFIVIILNDLGESVAQLLMKKGIIATGVNSITWSNLSSFLFHGALSPLLVIGLLLYLVNFFIWIVALSRSDLSIATIVGSAAYVLVPLFGVIFLGETVSLMRWAGVGCIVAGIIFVSQSKSTTPVAP